MADYNILALGPPGSGKTVYLAALYNWIVSGQLADGVKIDLNFSAGQYLAETYGQVADPTSAWPPGTSSSAPPREFQMRFSVQRTRRPWLFGEPKHLSYPAFSINYIDYAGEWLTEANRQDRQLIGLFDERLNTANVLLCFIDGSQLLGLMEGRKKGATLIKELGIAVDACKQHPSAPVVIVATKWDLLAGRGIGLEHAVQTLLNYRQTGLAGLVAERGGRRRLIKRPTGGIWVAPVSATGSEFVQINSEGQIVKVGYGEPQPQNISVPLTTGLVEVARLELHRHKKGARKAGNGVTDDILKEVGEVTKLAGFSGELVGTARVLTWPATFAFYKMRYYRRRFRARGVNGVSSQEGAVMYIAGALHDQQRAQAAVPEYRVSKLWGDGQEWAWQ